jgi:hypothetical protein
MFKERLGLVIEKEDEITCAVGGCNFLLRAIGHEAFTYTNGQSNFLTFPSEQWTVRGGAAGREGAVGTSGARARRAAPGKQRRHRRRRLPLALWGGATRSQARPGKPRRAL